MNEMRKIMEIIEQASGIASSPTINRFVIRHISGAYVSNFSFGDNSKITSAKLFLTSDAATFHLEELSGKWQIIPVAVTIREIT